MDKLVSIIIPTFNGGKYLVKTIVSALAQTYPNKEIIVVDDGSTQDIATLLKQFKDLIILIRQENSGPGAARRRGFEHSRGEFIAFLDHDDIWSPDNVTRQVDLLENDHHIGLSYTYPQLIDQDDKLIPNEPPSFFTNGEVFKDFLKGNRITTFSATMLRRIAYESVGGIDPDIRLMTCDDYDLWLRIAARFLVAFAPGNLVFYRIHPGNFVKNYELNLNAHVTVIDKCRKNLIPVLPIHQQEYCNILIKDNLFDIYKKFAFTFYYDQQKASRILSRKFFIKALTLKPGNLSCWFYYIMNLYPFVILRKGYRKIRHYYEIPKNMI
jgi:glycosyltransferase involved in cell wall biosynthesis